MNAQRHWLWGTVLRSPPIKSSPSVHKASGIQFNSSSTPIVWVKQVLYSSDKADLHGFITRAVVSFGFITVVIKVDRSNPDPKIWGLLKNTLKNLAFYSYFLQEKDELVIARDVFPTAENNAVAVSLVSGCGKLYAMTKKKVAAFIHRLTWWWLDGPPAKTKEKKAVSSGQNCQPWCVRKVFSSYGKHILLSWRL